MINKLSTFKSLTDVEVVEMRETARKGFNIENDIPDQAHPVFIHECMLMIIEAKEIEQEEKRKNLEKAKVMANLLGKIAETYFIVDEPETKNG